jgi:tetratricopeptide (TPR) repeat protein
MRVSFRWWNLAVAAAAIAFGLADPSLRGQEQPDPVQLVQQGRRLNTAGRQADALALYERALRINPDLFEAHLASGIALDLVGRYDEARTHLSRAIERAPEDAKRTALMAMAVSWAFEGKTEQASEFYRQVFDADAAAGRHADAAEIANALGRLYLETGDTKSARRWYETGYEKARRLPEEPASQLKLWEFRWLHAQARIAAREGRLADDRLRAVRALVASSKELADQAPAVAYLEGYVALYRRDPSRALAALTKADQNDPFILMLMARSQQQLKRGDEARRTWQQILTLNGHSLQNALARPAARAALAAK